MRTKRQRLDAWDLAALVGLFVIGYGLFLWAPPFGVIFVGLVIFGLGVWGSYRWAL